MIDEVRPQSCMEWLWTLDLVELSWEILRYRRLKMRVLALDRAAAIEAIVLRVDGEGVPIEAVPMVRQYARRAAADWRADPQAAVDIEAHLKRNGFDQTTSMRRRSPRYENCSFCSTTSCSLLKAAGSHCWERFASAENLPDALVRL